MAGAIGNYAFAVIGRPAVKPRKLAFVDRESGEWSKAVRGKSGKRRERERDKKEKRRKKGRSERKKEKKIVMKVGGRREEKRERERERERVEMRRSCRGFGVYSLLSRWSPTPNGSPRLYPGPS